MRRTVRRDWRRSGAANRILAILDLMLPDANGLDLFREIRAMQPSAPVPVIMLTARGDPVDRVVGLEMGAEDYIPKPFEPRELLARIRVVLRRARSAAGSASCASGRWRSTAAPGRFA